MTACARSTAPAASSPLGCLSWGAPGAVSACPDDASQAAVRPRLANRGATFPEALEEKPESLAEDLRGSVAARWRLKKGVVGLLRDVERGNGRSYAVCGCGHAAKVIDENGDLQTVSSVKVIRHGPDDRPFVSGTLRCESPWLCPTCAPKRAIERKERFLQVIEGTDALGGSTAFVTLTVSHKEGQSLKELKALLSGASRAARQGRKWREIQEKGGVLGVIQSIEVLHNRHTGWHYHAHLLVPCAKGADDARAAMLDFINRYMEMVGERGGKARFKGQDLQIVDASAHQESFDRVASYAAKGSASWEIAGGLKDVRARDSRTPWDLVQLAHAGDEAAGDLFREYAEAIVGTRSGLVSSALAEKLGIKADQTDDQPTVVEDEADTCEVHVEILTERWRKLMSYGVAWKVLQAAEDGGQLHVETTIAQLLSGIEGHEHRQAVADRQAVKIAQTAEVAVMDLAERVMMRRAMGDSWSRAKAQAIDDLKTSLRAQGKSNLSMPSDAAIGRAVARLMERRW